MEKRLALELVANRHGACYTRFSIHLSRPVTRIAMPRMWEIKVFEKQQLLCSCDVSGALEVGRQKNSDEPLNSLQLERSGRQRLVIAKLDEINVSMTSRCRPERSS